ncbi:MmgE/PrpD family protein [Hydrogenophaga sp.]|jgi:2-methylcitrate dehydratase PrpD|uniref:MmgE/PrpD family protein n=1 Tax=Hydrogenophaga sp. TaxID=1904254 RepID=UPI0027356B21|nr:MmgE/PrpD family protein [Hydrogenophaga sp.]MDP3887665.1 MmgE/PrpD family protein [Hydrogenophaga sp.]
MIAVTQQLARFAADLRFDDLPPEVVDRTKLLFMDLSGIIIRSQSLDSSLVLKETLRDLGLDSGALQVQGSAERWLPQAAALLAGAAAHSLDFDDTHAPAQLHPGAPIIPAALAAAQMVGASTRDLIVGIVAGYEVMIRVALGLPVLKHGERGFHPSATVGVFGATAAAGNLFKLSPEQMEHAFGTALSESAGTGQFVVNGSWTKRFHVGNAAAGGVLAASLARRGYTGATQAFEGKEGFFNVYSPEPQPDKAVEGLGSVWEILRSGLKPYPCCRGIHAPLDAVMNLHAKHPIDIAQIESVRVGLARRSVYVVGEPQERRRNPRNVVDCQFSTHLCLSIALKHRHMGWDDYEPALADPEIRALMQRIDVYEDAECESNFPTAFSGLVEIRTRDGQTWREFVYAPRGEPETMLSAAELRAKFSLLVSAVLGAVGETALFNAIQAMDQPNAVDTLFVAPARQ